MLIIIKKILIIIIIKKQDVKDLEPVKTSDAWNMLLGKYHIPKIQKKNRAGITKPTPRCQLAIHKTNESYTNQSITSNRMAQYDNLISLKMRTMSS